VLVLEIMPGFSGYEGLPARLARHTNGKSCLDLKRIARPGPGGA
jgi:hypothetical protein